MHTLMPFQQEAVIKMLTHLRRSSSHACYNASEQGCVDGEAVITVNRAGIARKISLHELWYSFNGGRKDTQRGWDSAIPIRIRSFNGQYVCLNTVRQVLRKGLKETLYIQTASASIHVTPDHEILTTDGWRPAYDLSLDSRIALDFLTRHQTKKEHTSKPKQRYLVRQVGAYHPYARANTLRGKPIKLVDTHRLIMEAFENGLTFEDMLDATFSAKKAKHLKFNDPKIYHIHHINKNTFDNCIENLHKFLAKDHMWHHVDYARIGHGFLQYEKIKAIRPAGKRDVYDIVMAEPHRNFVANNIVVHNCGKTIMAIAAADALRAESILVICPAVMRLTWDDEIKKWAECKNTMPILESKQMHTTNEFDNATWVITSYALASGLPLLNALCSRKWDLLILDEAHACKNKRARRTRACLIDLWRQATYRLLLSGTPCTTSIIDLYTAARKCAPEQFKDFDSFADRYTYKRMTPWGCKYYGLKNGDELKAKVRKHFFIRYTKQEVLPDLPPKTFQQITLPSNLAIVQKTKDDADKLQAEVNAVADAIRRGHPPVIPKNLAEHRRLQGERKIPAVVEFCENLLEQEIPIVVFGWHTKFIADLSDELKAFNPAIITGATPAGKRHQAVARFQEGQTNLFIANLIAGGVGITLHRASICVLGELDWAPSTVAQSTDRLHRIGTRNPVTVYYFVVKDSIDEALSNAVIGRAKTISKVVDN